MYDIFWQFVEIQIVFWNKPYIKNLILKILRIYFCITYYFSIFQKKRIWVTELIRFQEGKIQPHPHRFHA